MTGPDVAPAVQQLSRRLLPEAPRLAPLMADRIRTEITLYRDADGVPAAALDASCLDNLRFVLGNLAGTPSVDAAVPRTTGVARAEAGVPYSAVLHAYRVGGRFIWELLVERADAAARDTLLLAAADIWAVTDDLSAQVTDGYRTTLAERARRDGQVRAALLGTLLDGDGAAAEQLWEAASVLHLPRQAQYAVVTAQGAGQGAEALPGIEEQLRRSDVVSAWRLDHDHHDGLVLLRPRFGVEQLVERLTGAAAGRVGLSTVHNRVDEAHRALREARLACAAGSPLTAEVVRFGDRPTATMLATTPEAAEATARRILGAVLDLPAQDRGTIVDTARVWFGAGGSTSAAAQLLHLHRNSVRYRLRRLEDLTARSLGHPVDLAEIHLALEAARILAL